MTETYVKPAEAEWECRGSVIWKGQFDGGHMLVVINLWQVILIFSQKSSNSVSHLTSLSYIVIMRLSIKNGVCVLSP